MRNFILAVVCSVAAASPISAYADAIYVVRPEIGRGTVDVLPQDAFSRSSSPSAPSNPSVPSTPDNGGWDFLSDGYGEHGGIAFKATSKRINKYYFNTVSLKINAPTVLEWCAPVDDKRVGLSASVGTVMDMVTNTGNVLNLRPLKAGRFGLQLTCKGEPWSVVVDVELTATE
jgi:hypothetical protein